MVDWTELVYLPDERVWFISSIQNGFEVALGGTEQAPHQTRLRLAEKVVQEIESLRIIAVNFLNANTDSKRLRNSEWHLEGLEFGRELTDPINEFDVMFTTDEGGDWNDCRSWYVRCLLDETESARVTIKHFRTEW